MTAFTVRRGDFRAAVASILPHAGKESEDTPDLGRLRFIPGAADLTVVATDYGTAAAARARITGHVDGDLDTFDLTTQSCKQALAVFQGPTNPDARAMWEDGDLLVELGDEHVRLAEVGGLVPARERHLRVPRILPAGEDTYPDVPRTLTAALDRCRLDGHAYPVALRGEVESWAKVVASTKAWGSKVAVTPAGPVGAIVRCADRFIALLGTTPERTDEDREEAFGFLRGWRDELAPLRRPAPRKPTSPDQPGPLATMTGAVITTDQVQAATQEVRDALAATGATITLVRAGDHQ